MMKMSISMSEYLALKSALEALGTGINERFKDEQKETLEKVGEMLNERDSRSASISDGWHEFNKVERYLDSLIRVASVEGHKVHEEINEAVKKLKEMAYQG
jgi:hypothetical protein